MEVEAKKPLIKMLLELMVTVMLFSFGVVAPDESPIKRRVKIKPQNSDLRFSLVSLTST